MTVTNASSGTNVHEIADGIYRINTPVATPLCGDLFTQPGAEHAPLTEGDIPGPSEKSHSSWTISRTRSMCGP
jgi:hypothetical protein